MPNRSRNGVVKTPSRVVAATRVNFASSILTERAAGRTITRVTVQIGHLRQVVPDALSFAWEMLREQTATFSGSTLEIDHVPATISCPACATVTTLTDAVLLCPGCGSADVVIETGEEFMLVSFEMPNDAGPSV